MRVCHWKAHHAFTYFYLKDVKTDNGDLMNLGSVVLSDYTTLISLKNLAQGERKGGWGEVLPVLGSSKPYSRFSCKHLRGVLK